jgi:hypothetical protein
METERNHRIGFSSLSTAFLPRNLVRPATAHGYAARLLFRGGFELWAFLI